MTAVWAVKFWPIYKYELSGAVPRSEVSQWNWSQMPKFVQETLPADLRAKQPSNVEIIQRGAAPAASAYMNGERVDPAFIPNAVCVYDEEAFARAPDIFIASTRLCFKGEVPGILQRADLGGAELIRIPSLAPDFKTPRTPRDGEGDIYTINFGATKDTLLLERCGRIRRFSRQMPFEAPSHQLNDIPYPGELVLSQASLQGPNLWSERYLTPVWFMHDSLAQPLFEVGALSKHRRDFVPAVSCTVVEG